MRQLLYKKEIEEIKNSGYLKKELSITDVLIDVFYNEILKNDEKEILKAAFDKNLKQDNLDNLLKIWDIEVKGANKSLMLAYIMKLHPEIKFTRYEEPRLKGLLNFFRFKNMETISHYVKIVKLLNDNDIIPMILKGGAMKYLRPDLPRIMGDIDILVNEKDFMKSLNLAVSLGYTYDKIDIHSVDLHKPNSEKGILDIHRFIYMHTGYEKKFLKDLYKRARLENVFGVKTLVPSNEDMVFIALVNLARNLRNKTSQNGLIYSLFDCSYLQASKSDFDWNIVKDNAKKTRTEIQMNFAIKFLKKISDNVFPEIMEDNMLFKKETNEYSNMVMFDRFYLSEMRQRSRNLKVVQIFSDKSLIKEYLSLKPKYFILKQLRKHPKLIELLIKDLKTKEYDFENM